MIPKNPTILYVFFILILAYLVFTNATGASGVIRQIGMSTAGVTKVLQGRG